MANQIREEIMFFAQAMEDEMRKNDKVKGDSWKDMPHTDLQCMLNQEVEEANLDGAKLKEWIDVANYCMMVYCNTLKFRG